MGKKQTTSSLPHLPHSIAMPQVQVTGEKPRMPGQKSLPSADWKNTENQQLVPGMDTSRRNRKVVVKQGVPCTSRPSKNPLPANVEPPPMFSSHPSTVAALRSATESKTQKQMHRMEGGIDPVVLLTTRLESWRLAIKNLVTLFKKVVLVENRTSKGLMGASTEIELPFKNSNGQFLENGGIQDVFAAIRDYTLQHGIMHHETSNYLQGAVIPALRAIKSDIKTMMVEIEKDKSLKSIYIYDSRTHVNRLIDRLGKTIESVQYSPHTADQNPDPFLLNLSVIHAIRDLCDNENRLHDNIMNLQHEVAIFESKIIENTRHVLQGFHDYRLENKMEHEDFIGTVTDTFDNMGPSTEWNSFVQRNQYNLVQTNSAYKTENDIDYPSQHSRFVRASKIGPLQLKTGITKGWTEGIYILTPAGYLHGYKTPKHFQSNPLRPTYSIFVPNSTVDTDEDTFELRSQQKINVGNRYIFRAPTRGENQSWYESLSSLSQKFDVPPLLEPTENNFSNTPSHRDLPPLPANILPLQEGQRRAIEAPPSGPREIKNEPYREQEPVVQQHQEQASRQEHENYPTPKQQYLKAYPAAEHADNELEKVTGSQTPPLPTKAPVDRSSVGKSNLGQSSTLGRSDTISGDNTLANITAGGQASSNNYVAGESTTPIKTDVYKGQQSDKGQDKNFGKYESSKPIVTNVYDDKNHKGNYESTPTPVKKTNAYENYDDDDSSDDNAIESNVGKYAYVSSDRAKYGKYEGDGYSYGKHFTSANHEKSAGGAKHDTSGNHFGLASDGHKPSSTGDKFSQRLASNESFGQHASVDGSRYDPSSGYQPKVSNHFSDEDSLTLGRDEYSNSKQGLPGL